MDLFTAIEERLSYRGGFKSEAISTSDLIKIVEAGLKAPSGKNAQTTNFVIINDANKLREIQSLHPTNRAMREAQAYIACIVDDVPDAIYEGHSFQIEDCAAAVQNMLLAITALGYGSVWIDGWLRLKNRAETIGQWLDLPKGKVVRVLLPIGIPTEAGVKKQKKAFHQRAAFNTYRKPQEGECSP